MKQTSTQTLIDSWYGNKAWLHLLRPLAWALQSVASLRRMRLQSQAQTLAVPVIVVGNISLGGTGKTPLLAALAQQLQERGFKPGIVSRGYGGSAPHYPFLVTADSMPEEAGDEPVLLAEISGCPVVVDPNRTAAAKWLLANFDCDVLLSDDGLQHYSLARNIEIAVVDGARGLGNGKCLPAGPLREPPARLQEVDWVIVNGELRIPAGIPGNALYMHLQPARWVPVNGVGESLPAGEFPWRSGKFENAPDTDLNQSVEAIAGIGNPQRFFDTLSDLGVKYEAHCFADHHQFTESDFAFAESRPVIMTAKDAVKCRQFARSNWWYLSVQAELPEYFYRALADRIRKEVLILKSRARY